MPRGPGNIPPYKKIRRRHRTGLKAGTYKLNPGLEVAGIASFSASFEDTG
jgi:hypothetical protein